MAFLLKKCVGTFMAEDLKPLVTPRLIWPSYRTE